MSKATESQESHIFLPFLQFMKRPQTKLHADTICDSKHIKSK